ncbi:MAG: type II secretion system protein [Verrucomicrobiia bacterium]
MKPFSSKHRAFTLIELLAVIGIIGVLVALLIPAIKSSLIKAEVSQAQSGISNLSTAFKAYYTEYGKWPISDTAATWNYVVDANMVALLSGSDIEAPYSTAQPTIESFGVVGGTHGTFQGNPRKIIFLQFKQSDLGNVPNCTGCYLDPWKKAYYVKFDVTYAGVTPSPFENTNYWIASGSLIWSDGPDGQENTVGGGVGINKDNVTSW